MVLKVHILHTFTGTITGNWCYAKNLAARLKCHPLTYDESILLGNSASLIGVKSIMGKQGIEKSPLFPSQVPPPPNDHLKTFKELQGWQFLQMRHWLVNSNPMQQKPWYIQTYKNNRAACQAQYIYTALFNEGQWQIFKNTSTELESGIPPPTPQWQNYCVDYGSVQQRQVRSQTI